MRKRVISLLLFAVITLLGLGIIVLSSASTVQSERQFGTTQQWVQKKTERLNAFIRQNPESSVGIRVRSTQIKLGEKIGTTHFLLLKQLIFVLGGIVLAFMAQGFDYHNFKLVTISKKLGNRRFSHVPILTIALYCFILLALILVFVPPIGIRINGSWRWIDLIVFNFQPSEVAKIVMIITMSVWLDRIGSRTKTFMRGTFWSLAILAPYAGLIVCQPDLGATMVVSLLAVVLMIVAGVSLKHLLPVIGGGIASLAVYLAVSGGYHTQKVVAWLYSCGWYRVLFGIEGVPDMSRGDHLRASLHAIQSGGVWGVGYTHSLQKYRYLPESHTDFVFPIGAEEFGVIFSLGVALLFFVVLVCGILICMRTEDKLGRYLALGLTFMIVFQGMFNLMVVTGLAPTKGIALPFFSYGGTSIFSIMIAVGMLINIAKHMETRSEEAHTLREKDVLHTL